MAHFAQIENNIVLRVIVVDNSNILDEQGNESESVGSQFCTDLLGGTWVQTSYNSNMRKNYAQEGDTFDSIRNAFIKAKPEGMASWVLDEETCQYTPPITAPTEGSYFWNEDTEEWSEQTPLSIEELEKLEKLENPE